MSRANPPRFVTRTLIATLATVAFVLSAVLLAVTLGLRAQVRADVRAELERRARQGDRSLSAQVRRAIAEHLQRSDNEEDA